jgi:hypothetical protein
MFAGFSQRLNFGNTTVGTVSVPSAFPTIPIGQLGNFNTFAINFLTVTGITDPTIQVAINQLSYDLVNTGLINKMIAIYPFVGGTSTTHQYNLKDPRDADTAFRLTFVGGWTHSSTGILPNGTNAYANTLMNGLSNFSQSNCHLSFYSRTTTVGAAFEINALPSGGASVLSLRPAVNFGSGNTTNNQGTVVFTTTTNATGYWIGSKTSTSERFGFRNGVLNSVVTTTNDTTNQPSIYVILSARNSATVGTTTITPLSYSSKECCFATLGFGLSQAECATLYTIVQNFQTILGRQL